MCVDTQCIIGVHIYIYIEREREIHVCIYICAFLSCEAYLKYEWILCTRLPLFYYYALP